MAESSHLERMGRELKCPICLSLLNSAVSLTCNHVFCNSCIEKSMKSASNCPVCKVPYQRREVRPAPHMDNLVSIYKSMEVSSGVSIFVTQTALSTKLSGGEIQPEQDMVCGREENGRTRRETPNTQNQRRLKVKGSKGSSKTNSKNSSSNLLRPSFPTKKRVQVPEHPPSETPTRSAKLKGGMDELTKDGPQKSSAVLKNKAVLNKGEPVLSPFFWLREEEDAEKSSPLTDEDLLMDTPPDAPCFSDIKGSDDEVPCRMTSKNGPCIASYDADFFDSEMFEWTQRACSPELCSSPLKMQVKETDEYERIQGKEHKLASQVTATNGEPRAGNRENMIPQKGTNSMEVTLPTSSSPETKNANNEDRTKRPNKRRRKESGRTRNKRAKRAMDEVLRVHTGVPKAEDNIREKKHGNKGNSANLKEKTCKRDKKVGMDTSATEAVPEDVSTLSNVAKPPNQGDRTRLAEFSASLDHKKGSDDDLKRTGTKGKRTIFQQHRDCARGSKTWKLNFAMDNITQSHNGVLISQSPNKSFPIGNDKKVSDSNMQARESVDKNLVNPTCAKKLESSKKMKISMDDNSKVKGIDDNLQSIHEKVATNETQPFGKNKGNSEVRVTYHSSNVEKALPISNEILRKCGTISNKVQCAFCQSKEDSEASGVMVHYLKGKPVTANYNGGSNVIHTHRNCTEWAPNVYFEDDNAINLEAELARSRRIKCCCCGIKGAALGCYEKSCRKSFHVPCAKLTPQFRWDSENFVMLCSLHASSKLPNEISGSQPKQKKKCIPKRQSHIHQPQVVVKHVISTSWRWNSHGSSKKLILCCSALNSAEKETASEFVRISGATVLKNWDSSVTHVIASTDENGACRRTLKFLKGILEGKWILSIEWVKACLKANEPIDEQRYEINVDIHGVRDGPRLGRLRLLNKQPKLFDGYKFYFTGDFIPSYKGYLHDLVIAAGGTVLHRKPVSSDHEALPSKCSTSPTFIIYSLELPDNSNPNKRNLIFNGRRSDAEALASSTGAVVATNSWILNSIAACRLQNLAQ